MNRDTLAELDAELDVALERRVAAHRARDAGELTVPEYLRELRDVRALEDAIEPRRQALGATLSRAAELVIERGEAAQCERCGGLRRLDRDCPCALHEPAQLTIDGREEPLPEPEPADVPRDAETDAERLFDFPTTMRGQTALDTDGGSP